MEHHGWFALFLHGAYHDFILMTDDWP